MAVLILDLLALDVTNKKFAKDNPNSVENRSRLTQVIKKTINFGINNKINSMDKQLKDLWI